MMDWVEQYGYAGLFLFSLLAATIIPVSSESALAGAILLKMEPMAVLFWATIGNCGGTLINYFLGKWIGVKWLDKKVSRSQQHAYNLAKKYGWWSLLLSWLPIIGDPITIVAGILRWNFINFMLIVFPLRFIRYYIIVYLLV